MCVSSTVSDNFRQALWHVDALLDHLLRKRVLDFAQPVEEVREISWLVRQVSETSSKHVPYVLNWIQVWTPSRMRQDVDVVLLKEGSRQTGVVAGCIILHQRESSADSSSNKQHVWPQNFVHVSLSTESGWWNKYQLSSTG